MRRTLAALTATACLFSLNVQAQSVVATSNILVRALDRSLNFTSDTTTSLRDMKVVMQAREDAASFVASNGALHSAQLNAAFERIRAELPEAQGANDLQLAQAILAL